MRRATLLAAAAAAVCLCLCAPAPGAAPGERLVVCVKQSPPFTIRNDDGSWRGISVDLWREIAAENGWSYEFRETSLTGLIHAVRTRQADAGMAALTITAEREESVDFSHAYFTSGLGIVTQRRATRWQRGLLPFLSLRFLRAVGMLSLVLLTVGFLVWLFERRKNAEQFGGGALRGIGAAFWWSAVTMTTVGYGDKSPRTFGGRVVALVWMFTAIIIISGFTAAIASALTVHGLDVGVRGLQDLHRSRAGTVPGTSSESFLADMGIRAAGYTSVEAALADIRQGKLDAFVYDAPLLRYAVEQDGGADLVVIPVPSHRELYGFAFPTDSPLREPANRALLRKLGEPEWKQTVEGYLGKQM
jgi:ABC-type amino acid transport substrate-binding protein